MIKVKKANGSVMSVNDDMIPHLKNLGLELVTKQKAKPRARKPKAEKLD